MTDLRRPLRVIAPSSQGWSLHRTRGGSRPSRRSWRTSACQRRSMSATASSERSAKERRQQRPRAWSAAVRARRSTGCTASMQAALRPSRSSRHHRGRPLIIDGPQVRALIQVALSRPQDLGLPFTRWSVSKLRSYCLKEGLIPPISGEWVRRLLGPLGGVAGRPSVTPSASAPPTADSGARSSCSPSTTSTPIVSPARCASARPSPTSSPSSPAARLLPPEHAPPPRRRTPVG